MLTVKHIGIQGHENLYPATRVSYQPAQSADGRVRTGQVAATDDIAASVSIDTPKGDTVSLGSWGAFYIMNEAGKTVAKYDLGGWDTPKTVSTTWTATAGTSAPDSVRVTRVG